jgi:hypothetical protein
MAIAIGAVEASDSVRHSAPAALEDADDPLADAEPLSLAGEVYVVGFTLTSVPVFLLTWLFCAMVFGLPLGGGLGWIAGLAAGAAAGAVWPVGVMAAIALIAAI